MQPPAAALLCLIFAGEQRLLYIPELLRKVNIVIMRIFKALYLVPLQIELSRAIITDLRRRRRFIDALTTEEDRLLQLLDTVILEHLTLPDMLGVEQLERLARVDNLVAYGDKVGYRLSAVALINAIELL